MKKIAAVFTSFIMSACATTIPYSFEEKCADSNMKLTGVAFNSSSGPVSVGNTSGNFSYSGKSLMCEVPKTDEEKNRISFLQKNIIAPKDEYNETVGYKRWITGIGYYFLIIPGVAAMYYYDYEREKETKKIYSNADIISKQTQQNPASALVNH